MESKPSIGVALICLNGEHTLGACLDSIRPYVDQIVVCVDDQTTDKTAEVAAAHRADVIRPFRMLEDHECEFHGKLRVQHFAKARTFSFSLLDPNLDWWGWIDADDIMEHGELLRPILGSATPEQIGLFLPYRYGTLQGGEVTNTIFDRERFMRPAVGWEWQGRVHEVIKPLKPGSWMRADDVTITHQEGKHKSQDSIKRNLVLLQIDLEENPNDQRAIFYMANALFAAGEWAEAVMWYERTVENEQNPYQCWQSYVYMSMAYERLRDAGGAISAAFGALDALPYHPEPYYRLATIYCLIGQYQKALFWIDQGKNKSIPPPICFTNPLDYSYHPRLVAADAYGGMGNFVAARRELEAAVQVLSDDRVVETIAKYEKAEHVANQAVAAANVLRGREALDTVSLYEALKLEPDVKTLPVVRNVVMPQWLKLTRPTKPTERLTIICGGSLEPWGPPSLNEGGIGGSETAVVEIAKRFARDGWRVDVYAAPGKYEGEYDGAGFWDFHRYVPSEPSRLWVSWRHPDLIRLDNIVAEQKALWCHDLHFGPDMGKEMHDWEEQGQIWGVSDWHAEMLNRYYGLSKASWVPNGVDLARFEGERKRKPFQVIYSSSPDRGLAVLLNIWRRVVEVNPDAKLLIAYGWNNIDTMIARGDSDLAAFKADILRKLKETPNVEWLGRLPQNKLADLFSESYCWAYPTTFLEVSCITAMEAMAAGCAPVVSTAGALPTTIGKAGMFVPGVVTSPPWQQFYARVLVGMMSDRTLRQGFSDAGRERAKQLTWDAAYEVWRQRIASA